MTKTLPALTALLLAVSCTQPAPAPAIEVQGAWARATAPGQPNGAVYATIVNSGSADSLVGATTSRGSQVMLHENQSSDGIARMRMVETIAIPASGKVTLEPGGAHLMLSGGPPFMRDETFDLRLRFAVSGEQLAKVSVVAPGSR